MLHVSNVFRNRKNLSKMAKFILRFRDLLKAPEIKFISLDYLGVSPKEMHLRWEEGNHTRKWGQMFNLLAGSLLDSEGQGEEHGEKCKAHLIPPAPGLGRLSGKPVLLGIPSTPSTPHTNFCWCITVWADQPSPQPVAMPGKIKIIFFLLSAASSFVSTFFCVH